MRTLLAILVALALCVGCYTPQAPKDAPRYVGPIVTNTATGDLMEAPDYGETDDE